MLQKRSFLLVFLDDNAEVLSGETLFLRIGPLLHRTGPRVSPDRTFSKADAPFLKNHPVCVQLEGDPVYRWLFKQELVTCGTSPRGQSPAVTQAIRESSLSCVALNKPKRIRGDVMKALVLTPILLGFAYPFFKKNCVLLESSIQHCDRTLILNDMNCYWQSFSAGDIVHRGSFLTGEFFCRHFWWTTCLNDKNCERGSRARIARTARLARTAVRARRSRTTPLWPK